MKLQALPSAGIGFASVVFIGAFRGAGFAFICIPGIGFACGFMLCFGRFVSFQIYIGVKRNGTARVRGDVWQGDVDKCVL